MTFGSAIALATERIVEPIEGMHRAIARRWFAPFGSGAKPVRVVHDAISSVVYGSVRSGGTAVGIALDVGKPVDRATADSVQALVNGLWGDSLGRHEDRLRISMGIRDQQGSPVAIDPDLTVAFPGASGSLVVLVHGLCETEQCWQGTGAKRGLGSAIADHPALTPVSIRYNTGLRVSVNGSRLSSLLEEVHAAWPVPVQSVALVGSSMGGLVVRSALASGRAAGHSWIEDVVDVVTVGSPHRGTPLEKAVNVMAWGLGIAPETRPLADFLNTRSVGIKDLRFGAVADEDWKGIDPDALMTDTVGDHFLPRDVRHHFVAGAITADPRHPVGVVMGDLVVRAASGIGAPRLDPTSAVVIGDVSHFALLREPVVIDFVMGWLGRSI